MKLERCGKHTEASEQTAICGSGERLCVHVQETHKMQVHREPVKQLRTRALLGCASCLQLFVSSSLKL